jgi:hypothetical protein
MERERLNHRVIGPSAIDDCRLMIADCPIENRQSKIRNHLTRFLHA